jgi:SAM-dependent methyltransferase
MKDEQEKTFKDGEGDAWYRRNRERLDEGREDWATRIIAALENRSAIRRVVELGCANGWRLAKLRPLFAPGCAFVGIDASAEALADGRRRFPQLELRQGMLSDVPLQEPFDLAIVHFVLHWADRHTLSRSIAEIDRLVSWNGYLVIGDFLPDFPTKRRYHHLPQQAVFTYKQDYAQAFLGLGFYREIARLTFDHDRPAADPARDAWAAPAGRDERAMISLLHKSAGSYVER